MREGGLVDHRVWAIMVVVVDVIVVAIDVISKSCVVAVAGIAVLCR